MTGFKIEKENTNLEIFIKMMNSIAKKYDCSFKADFKNGNRKIFYRGDQLLKPHILAEMTELFPGLSMT